MEDRQDFMTASVGSEIPDQIRETGDGFIEITKFEKRFMYRNGRWELVTPNDLKKSLPNPS